MRKLVPTLGFGAIRALDVTWSYRETGRDHFDRARASGRPVIGAFLHGHLFMLMAFITRPGNGRFLSMCSKSLDGDALARIEERLGFVVIRGSTGSGGLQAIVDMVRRVRAEPGLGSCLAIDGSRGPRGVVQIGTLALAQHTNGVIVPVAASAHRAHVFERAWDRAVFPLPFSRIEVVYGEPLEVPRKPGAQVFERLRLELERRITHLEATAAERAGVAVPEPALAPPERRARG